MGSGTQTVCLSANGCILLFTFYIRIFFGVRAAHVLHNNLQFESGLATESNTELVQSGGAGVCNSFSREVYHFPVRVIELVNISLKNLIHFPSVAVFMSCQDVKVAQC